MTISLTALGYQDDSVLSSSVGYFSSECADEVSVSLEAEGISNLFEAISIRLSGVNAANYSHTPLPPSKLLVEKLDTLKFSGVKDTRIQIPVGLNVLLSEYVEHQEKLTLKLMNLPQTLDIFYKVLGTIMNEPDTAKAQSAGMKLEHLPSIPTSEDLAKLHGMFDSSERTEAPFGSMVSRVTEYVDLYQRINELGVKASKLPIGVIYTKLNRFDPIIKTLRQNLIKNDVSPSGPFVAKLIEYSGVLAAASSVLGGYKQMITELVETSRNNYERLIK